MFDLGAVQDAMAVHGQVARVVIAGIEGSSPREVGASMLVWADVSIGGGQSGTIGGGALEFAAVARARGRLAVHAPTRLLPHEGEKAAFQIDRIALGPSLGQCCGGVVTLWTELHAAMPEPVAGVIARGPGTMPLAVRRVLAAARGHGLRPGTRLVQGWLVEPVAELDRQVWVWGAGHVGRAVVAVLAPLPGVAVTWVDVGIDRFPQDVPPGVTVVPATDPAALVPHAPIGAEHLVLTYSHALDLDLCHRLLSRGFLSCGLIGSATKRARFRSRLLALGHGAEAVERIICPIGDPALGKHPQAIAVGVAAEFLAARHEIAPQHGAIQQRGQA